MSDIVERLRICAAYDPDQKEAADTIETLRAENAKLREALKPFADEAGFIRTEAHDGDWYELDTVTVGEFRAAKTALGESDD